MWELMKIIQWIIYLIVLTMATGLFAGCSPKANENNVDNYPETDLVGYIMWGAGGGTDNVARALTPLVEKKLGKSIVLQNKVGATGAIATQYVYDQKPDGYSLLYGAENPQLYGVMDISKLSYSDFEPIILIGRETAIVVVGADSKYNTIEELIEDAKENPNKINLGTTGPGGLPFVVASLLKTASQVEFNQIPFDGDGPVITALLGNHVDVTVTKLSAAGELLRAGKVKLLASISNDPIEGFEDVPAIGKVLPEYAKYLPWGPFYGVFVHKETPIEIVEKLQKIYKEAFKEAQYQNFLENAAITPMGTSGDEAKEFLENWQQISSWLLYDSGGAKISPDTLGIERIK